MGTAPASAAGPPDPTFQQAPQFYNGNVAQDVRSAGSDTTFFLHQALADIYNQAGLYGCAVAGSGPFPCPSGQNISTTDVNDNWDRTEVYTGTGVIGSGDGQKMLCGTEASNEPVDFSRSSKPNGSVCTQETGHGFAYDGVPELNWKNVNPSQYGAIGAGDAPYFAAANTAANLAANGGQALMGPVANGWEPGDNAVNGPFSGTPFNNMTNTDHSGGATSESYRLYCVSGNATHDALNGHINDWGMLTNLNRSVSDGVEAATTDLQSASATFRADEVGSSVSGAGIQGGTTITAVNSASDVTLSLATLNNSGGNSVTITDRPGDGNPINIPIFIMGVNPSSGTNFTISTTFFKAGVGGTECDSDSDLNKPDASHVALENNANQMSDFITADFPTDPAGQAAELASSLYYMSQGVFQSNVHARSPQICSNGHTILTCASSGGTLKTFQAQKMNENGVASSSVTEGNKTLATWRILYDFWLNAAKSTTNGRTLIFTDGSTTASSRTIGSPALAQFQRSDVGRGVSGGSIPANSYICNVTSATSADFCNATMAGAGSTASGLTLTMSNTYLGLKASTAGYMNWLCATDTDGVLSKGLDLSTGLGYDQEVSNLINNTYGFNRITDVQTGSFANQCGLIYPTVSITGGALGNPYPGGVTTNALPGPIPFPFG
jgi:hypothetical protein